MNHGIHVLVWYPMNVLVGTEKTYMSASVARAAYLIELLERKLLGLSHEKERKEERQQIGTGIETECPSAAHTAQLERKLISVQSTLSSEHTAKLKRKLVK